MRMTIKNIVLVLGFLPLALKLPYLWNVWQHSPLERGDIFVWVSLLFMAPLAEWLRRHNGIVSETVPRRALLPLLAFAVLVPALTVAYVKEINAAVILLGVLLGGTVFELRFGRRVFAAQIPTLCMAVLGCPSLSYWLNYYMNTGLDETSSYVVVKLIAGWLFFALWALFSYRNKRYPRLISLLFAFCLCISLFANHVWTKHLPAGIPCYLNVENYGDGSRWVGRAIPLSAEDMRFFKGCTAVERRVYYTENVNIGVLAVTVGNDIHSIHPVGICLKSSGWTVLSSKQSYIDIPRGKIQVAEIEAEKDGQKFFVCAWFSNGTRSTGDFAEFRFMRKEGQVWQHYQLMTSLDNGVERARARIRRFVDTFQEAPVQAKGEKTP